MSLAAAAIFHLTVSAQPNPTNEWTWMQGNNSVQCFTGSGVVYCGVQGRYGAEGVWRASNTPGGRESAYTWTDSAGHLWLFGGNGYDAQFNLSYLNDLWEFDPAVNEWVWRGGASTAKSTISGGACDARFNPNDVCVIPGVYGTKGAAATGNIPGSHAAGESWTDRNGNFWLLGGYGVDANRVYGVLNDLWEYSPSSGLWTWVAGTNLVDQPGVYGTLGVPAVGNTPGARIQGFTWVDQAGSLWLFGGAGIDAAKNNCYLNDLWRFDISSGQWTWEGGVSTVTNIVGGSCGQTGMYGTEGTAASTNYPGGRKGGSSWTDSTGNLWLFGGWTYSLAGQLLMNDVWEFDPSSQTWTWWNGSSSGDDAGTSGMEGQASPNNSPATRQSESSWTDSNGNFWLFGGQVRFDDSCGCTFNDLWQYASRANTWAWESGSILTGAGGTPLEVNGAYGIQATPAAENVPGSRDGAMSWTDSNGNLWLFGGFGNDSANTAGEMNDLWRYALSSTVPGQSVPAVSVGLSTATINANQSLEVIVSVTGALGANIPTGSIEVSGAGYTSSTVPLSGGMAQWTIPAGALASGQDTLYADYIPDSASAGEYFGAYGTAAVTVTSPGFNLSAQQLSLQAGATTGNTVAVTVTPTGGFTGAVSLSASIAGAPEGATNQPTFSFGSTNPVNIMSTSAQTATLTVATTASQTTACSALTGVNPKPERTAIRGLLGIALLIGLGRRKRVRKGIWMLALTLLVFGTSSCGGGASGGGSICTPKTTAGTTPGTYQVFISATSGSLSANTTVTLQVN